MRNALKRASPVTRKNSVIAEAPAWSRFGRRFIKGHFNGKYEIGFRDRSVAFIIVVCEHKLLKKRVAPTSVGDANYFDNL